MSQTKSLNILLTLAADGTAPSEFLIFGSGINATTKGNFLFNEECARKCMSAVEDYGNQYSIDYDHGMVSGLALDPSEAKKAAGWFTPSVMNGELWATKVEWTPKAKAMIAAKEYRYISPAFRHSEDGSIEELINVALTNIPATKNMKPLVAHQDVGTFATGPVSVDSPATTEPQNMKNLISLLSLSDKASEADVVAEVTSLKEARTAFLSAAGKESMSEALGVVAAWKSGAEQTEVLSKRVADLEGEKRTGEIKAIVDGALKEKKVTPAQVAVLTKMGEKDMEMLKAFVAAAAPVVPVEAKEPTKSSLVAALSQEQIHVAKLFGRKPEELAAFVAKVGPMKVIEKDEAADA